MLSTEGRPEPEIGVVAVIKGGGEGGRITPTLPGFHTGVVRN